MVLLIAPGVGTLRKAQVAGPSQGQVPRVLWMTVGDQTVAHNLPASTTDFVAPFVATLGCECQLMLAASWSVHYDSGRPEHGPGPARAWPRCR
jgi:hypothetical protein